MRVRVFAGILLTLLLCRSFLMLIMVMVFHKPYILPHAVTPMIEGDEEVCIGCRTCEIVCALSLFNESDPEKSAIRIHTHPEGFEIRVCNQCGECEKVCPEGAIHREGNVVTIESSKCTGCYICVEACPMGVLFTHPDYIEPFKCNHCQKCVESCPVNALYVLELEF